MIEYLCVCFVIYCRLILNRLDGKQTIIYVSKTAKTPYLEKLRNPIDLDLCFNAIMLTDI